VTAELRLPPCPFCGSTRVILTSEHLDDQMFFCPKCEHSWTSRGGTVLVGKTKK
jgi:transposase-like protein